MNAVAQDSAPDLETALAAAGERLDAARAREAEARAAHEGDAEALARGQERLGGAQVEVKRLAEEDADVIARHAARLDQQTREGKTGPLPLLVLSDKHLAAQITAQRTHAAAVQMVASLEEAAKCSARELTARSAASAAAGAAVKAAEGELAAVAFELACAEVLRAGAQLWRYHITGLDTPLNEFSMESLRVQRALERFSAIRGALVDDRDVPLYQLRTSTERELVETLSQDAA
jgi:hypothetical protein